VGPTAEGRPAGAPGAAETLGGRLRGAWRPWGPQFCPREDQEGADRGGESVSLVDPDGGQAFWPLGRRRVTARFYVGSKAEGRVRPGSRSMRATFRPSPVVVSSKQGKVTAF
jgi:hypothetical protein